MKFIFLLAAVGILADLSWAQTRFVSEIRVENVDLINIFTHTNPANSRRRYSLLMSTYRTNINTYDPALTLVYPGEHMANNFTGYGPVSMFNFLYFPKEIRQVPRNVFGHDAVVHCDGTTTVGKLDGTVHVSDVSDFNFAATYGLINKLIPVPDSWKYHSGVWFEIDGDSRSDFLTCRTDFDSGMLRYAQLVWLEHPRDSLKGRWSVSVLKENACDTNLAFIHIRNGVFNQDDVVYTTGFHTEKIAFFWTEARNWDNVDKLEARVLEQGRKYYDISIEDLNNDGKPDLLFTAVGQRDGSVECYEIPTSTFQNPAGYVKHVIGSGFESRTNGANTYSPKTVRTFYPTANTQRKPWILVSGGDDGRAYYYMPTSEQANNWVYQRFTIADLGPNQEVSSVAVADIDGDGYAEIFISCHKQHRVLIYTFRP